MIAMVSRFLLATLALFLAQMIAGGLTVVTFGTAGLPAGAPGSLPFQIVSDLIIVSVLAWLARRSRWHGWRLAVALGVVLYGISSFNSIIEAVFFGFFAARTGGVILFMTALSITLFVPALLMFSREQAPPSGRSEWTLRVTPGRVASGAAIYLGIYFTFGLMVYPFIAEFYAAKSSPSLLQVFGMALLVRGPIFVALAALIVAASGVGRRETSLMVAVAMSLLGGVAPLIVPSSLFPDAVRWAHFVEVTTENFLFGWILGLLLTKRVRATGEEMAPIESPATVRA